MIKTIKNILKINKHIELLDQLHKTVLLLLEERTKERRSKPRGLFNSKKDLN